LIWQRLVEHPAAVEHDPLPAFVDDTIPHRRRLERACKERKVVIWDADVVDGASADREGLTVKGRAEDGDSAVRKDELGHPSRYDEARSRGKPTSRKRRPGSGAPRRILL
jgi:hypothetical protein